jgi:hypothetical protein
MAQGAGAVVVGVLFPELTLPYAILSYGIDAIRNK